MKKAQDIINTLTKLKPKLFERFHISSLGLFDSVVRDDFSLNSDIDIIIDYNKQTGVAFIELANYLEDQLQLPVDLVSRKGIKPKYFKEIEKDILYV